MKALVVDDDRVLADLLAFTLRKEGFQVVQAHDGLAALDLAESEQPNIILLDVNLPRTIPPLDGFMICARIREFSDTPIILLTVRADEDDIVHGLSVGADDYILKPFSPRQLAARVQAVLRRAGKMPQPAVFEIDELVYDPALREVRLVDQAPVTLTPLESRLLESLCRQVGHYVPVDALINEVWGYDQADRVMLRQVVRRLRAKLESLDHCPVQVENLPGGGYGVFRIRNQST
ncbi:MAG TPA: response regulator transcription factor [Levilinea sp.]|nr:response regulator transcription factor [Levilinea sp.]